jgi:protein O-GlcNAc transferase
MNPPSLAAARLHLRNRQWAHAVPLYQQVLQAQPTDVRSCLELSTCLQQLGLADEAVVIAKTALPHAQAPSRNESGGTGAADVQLQLAHLYFAQHRDGAAGTAYSALLSHPRHAASAAVGVAKVWLREGYPSHAMQALLPHAAGPDAHADVVHTLALALFEAGQAEAACERMMQWLERTPLQASPEHRASWQASLSNALMFASYTRGCHAWLARLGPLARRAYERVPAAPGRRPALPVRHNDRLRVGFVSADLNAHPVGYFLASFLPHLGEQRIEVALFSNGDKRDTVTEQLQRAASSLTNIAALDTAQAVQAIRAQPLDMLIDLSGHTQGHRLDVFAERACAVQASFLGYFSTTCVPAMDWLITDAVHVPEPEFGQCSERVAHLPHSRFCYQPSADSPEPAAPPSERNGYLSFGACANLAKLGDDCIALWARVLHADPTSRLVLRWKTLVDEAVATPLRERFAAHGVAPGRVELHGSVRHRDMLAAYAGVDIVLDTTPFSGATTSCEALWMGVPVLTLPADRPAGRQTASILHTLGMTQWVARDADDFVRIALACGRDAAQRRAWRRSLRARMAATTLGDGRAYAREFAQLLRRLVT